MQVFYVELGFHTVVGLQYIAWYTVKGMFRQNTQNLISHELQLHLLLNMYSYNKIRQLQKERNRA